MTTTPADIEHQQRPNIGPDGEFNACGRSLVEEISDQKPHFLDYDAVPPPEYMNGNLVAAKEEKHSRTALEYTSRSGEKLKLDKKYERDGEISDYELAASGYTKKEFTQDDNNLHLEGIGGLGGHRKHSFGVKPKHFLDENPIPPDYMLEQEMREHRSLDRNFERQQEQQQQQQRTGSTHSLSGGTNGISAAGRRGSADLNGVGATAPFFSSRSSRERFRGEPSYTLSRFLDSEAQNMGSPTSLPPPYRFPRGAAWTESFDSHYGSLPFTVDNLPPPILTEFAEANAGPGPQVECVYSLLSMLGSNDPLETSKKFLELSRNAETCASLRRSGCIPLIVQMMHSTDSDDNVRKFASLALHNVVHSHPDEKAGRREAKVLRLLDQIIDYCNFLKTQMHCGGEAIADDTDRHPLAAMSSLMKVSFDEEHRHAMCELGALHAISNLMHLDHAVHGPRPEDRCCNSLRRYALMALTNLTFGDENNKALLCSQKLFMEALVAQLDSAPDDLLQVTASVLRNLSWRADSAMKAVLNEIGTVTALARAAMKNKCENTLKAILSALWNLSAHCSTNKAEFCAVDGALAFLVDMLSYEGPSKTLKIIENAGGILRNVSSHIAVREDYRQILRERNCLAILLQQLKSESLTVVSNSCGTLWNLSARCPEDQKFLWDNGAVPMLRSLIHSKHTMISEGSSSALKNLLNFRPSIQNQQHLDPIARSMGLKKLPTLNVRKQKALEQELQGSKQHSETCDNLDENQSRSTGERSKDLRSNFDRYVAQRRYSPLAVTSNAESQNSSRLTRSAMLTKSESRDSVFSAKSDSVYEHLMRSHSASDACRKKQQTQQPQKTLLVPRTAFALDNETETVDDVELPIDYAMKYNEKVSDVVVGSYQETDLDQPTDFSLRYAENQLETDVDVSPPELGPPLPKSTVANAGTIAKAQIKEEDNANGGCGNEIILILEDSVKCYQTEDTPYVISNAASVTDLRQGKLEVAEKVMRKKYQRDPRETAPPSAVILPQPQTPTQVVVYGSGSYTPEKPMTYCEEGTPGYFSRYDSLSSLDEPHNDSKTPGKSNEKNEINEGEGNTKEIENVVEAKVQSAPSTATRTQPNVNSALETPLMFSRRSSMDSLVEEDVGPIDDKSSVVSEFSRLASGVISPSEIPDSPTQSMPQSPRRNSGGGGGSNQSAPFSAGVSPLVAKSQAREAVTPNRQDESVEGTKRPLRSVFEDNLNTFHVENTPAQFSSATSLSNLSFMDDEIVPSPAEEQVVESSDHAEDQSQEQPPARVENESSQGTRDRKVPSIISEGEEEEEEEECGGNNDDLLLASCINMGMNRPPPAALKKQTSAKYQGGGGVQMPSDEAKQYYTEDTPAVLSKMGSNTNLSAISICSSNNDLQDNTVYEVAQKTEMDADPNEPIQSSSNRHSLNLSDDVSSNASEGGAAASQSLDILQQCIRAGMKKSTNAPTTAATTERPSIANDPIEMLRRGGGGAEVLPQYLPVRDEMNKYLVEDSPCNFSIVSGLSNLTVGSSLVGPALTLKEAKSLRNASAKEAASSVATTQVMEAGALSAEAIGGAGHLDVENGVNRETEDVMSRMQKSQEQQQWQDDSLSSLSIDSEDDTNLLSQAIAAGCNRPKSNLGFSSISSAKRCSSQPIAINAANSASSLNSNATARHCHHRQGQKANNAGNGNESVSSVDSSDSNDNQSKSLFELCIRTGMNKSTTSASRDSRHSHHSHKHKQLNSFTTQSNPNLKQQQQFEPLPANLIPPHPSTSTSTPASGKYHHQHHHHQHHTPNRHQRTERERTKDEKLLLECINTGISKRAGGCSSGSHSIENSSLNHASGSMRSRDAYMQHTTSSTATSTTIMPKNVLATSAAAKEPHRLVGVTTSINAHSTATREEEQERVRALTAAAPDVEKNNSNKGNNIAENTNTTTSININNNYNTNIITNNIHPEIEIVNGAENENVIAVTTNTSLSLTMNHAYNINISPQLKDITIYNGVQGFYPPSAAVAVGGSPQSPEIVREMPVGAEAQLVNDIGCNRSLTMAKGLGSDESHDSHESYLMDTTMHLRQSNENISASTTPSAIDKHKDPDLMLKSVERLTLEFVTSAEQLRTNSSNDSVTVADSMESNKRTRTTTTNTNSSSLTVDKSNSNSTWNENTCPNDVSFPSVSITAPVVTSLRYDDNVDGEVGGEEDTEADHRDLYDFAEITPTNEEQPLISMGVTSDDIDQQRPPLTQPNSLDTETDTLMGYEMCDLGKEGSSISDGGTSGINFQLGGEVFSAAVPPASATSGAGGIPKHPYFNSGLTQSAIIAIEARALAENFKQNGDDDGGDLTFSITSFDLDQVRPPSGMDSLNSGCYADSVHATSMPTTYQHWGPQPSLQRSCTPHSPQLSTKSPKFPRRQLPAGLMARRALGQLPPQLGGSAESVNSSCNLLDNVKPPSLMDELLDSMISVSSIQSEVVDILNDESMATTISVSNYHTAAGAGHEFDDNTVTLQSCCDVMPYDDMEEDVTMGSESTPMASDNEFSSAESTQHKSSGSGSPARAVEGGKRSINPKQRRKEARDRFKTYTITADELKAIPSPQREEEVMRIEILESNRQSESPTNSASANRRRSGKDRYKTQTIIYPLVATTNATDESQQQQNLVIDNEANHFSLTVNVANELDQQPQHQDVDELLCNGGGSATHTVNSPINEQELHSIECCDQSSETESCCGNNLIYHMTVQPEMNDLNDNGDLENNGVHLQEAKGGGTQALRRPYIVKPMIDMKNIGREEDDTKAAAIRGRKKQKYISPYSMQYQRKQQQQQTVPARIANKRSNVGVAGPSAPSKIAQKKKIAEVTANANVGAPALERQGTFVQEAPTIQTDQIPIVEGTAKPLAQSSPTHRASKLPTKKSQVTSAQISASATRKIPTTATTVNAARRGLATAATQRSNSNAAIRLTANAERLALLSTTSRISATTPPSRSNSSINKKAAATATAKAAARVNQAQSRISSIWKRVDETKGKQQEQGQVKSKQRPIIATALEAAGKAKLKAAATSGPTATGTTKAGVQQLIRGATFDNTETTNGGGCGGGGGQSMSAAVNGVSKMRTPSMATTSRIATGNRQGVTAGGVHAAGRK